MPASLADGFELTTSLSREYIAPGEDGSEVLGALITVRARPRAAAPAPLELCLVLDASGSMHRFHLDVAQRELWRRIAEPRGDLACERADGQEGWLWSGETLREMRGLIRTPMMAVVRAIMAMSGRLGPEDRLSVVAFADGAEVLLKRVGAAERAAGLRPVIERLKRGVDDSGLGRGSRLADALCLARRVIPKHGDRPCRILIVSDGVVEDRPACLREVEAAADEGTVISAIGVGEEFDEELLMQIADETRGRYAYAPTAAEVEAALEAELEALADLAARRLTVTILPEGEVVFRELYQVLPAVSRFSTLWMERGGYRYRLGDLACGECLQLLAEFVLPLAAPGVNPVGRVRLEAGSDRAEAALMVTGTPETGRVWERDPRVIAAMEAVAVYLGERRAQQAAARADMDEATRQLRQSTRLLRRMGDASLAGDFEALAADLEAGRTASLNRTKRLKAATRRLGLALDAPRLDAEADPTTRDLVHERHHR